MRKLKAAKEIDPRIGATSAGSLPPKIEEALRTRLENALLRNGVGQEDRGPIIERLVEETTHGVLLNGSKLPAQGRGKPRDAAREYLSAVTGSLLSGCGLAGVTLGAADDEDDVPGTPGLIAEIESIVMTARDQAVNPSAPGVAARPARISNARKTLGKITIDGGQPSKRITRN